MGGPSARLRGVALFLGACLVLGAVAVIGGVLFQVVRGGTTVARAVAYALWLAALVALVLSVPAGSKHVWRSTRLPPLETWWFVAASTLLTVVGALVDALAGS
jgi:hypothetical protein